MGLPQIPDQLGAANPAARSSLKRANESNADDNDNKRLRRAEHLSQADDSGSEPEPMDTSSPSSANSTVDKMPYDQDEVVAELLSFYEFLIGIHLPAEALKRPPPEGWDNISQEDLHFLDKDDVVVSLLKHIPYIRQDKEHDAPQVYEDTMCNDFSGKYFERTAWGYDDREFSELMDVFKDEGNESYFAPYTATLFRQESGQHGWYLLLNTQDGTVDMWGLGADTRFYHSLKECLAALKDQYCKFEVYAESPKKVTAASATWKDESNALRDIYRTHGCFTASYQKQECLAAVMKYCDREDDDDDYDGSNDDDDSDDDDDDDDDDNDGNDGNAIDIDNDNDNDDNDFYEDEELMLDVMNMMG